MKTNHLPISLSQVEAKAIHGALVSSGYAKLANLVLPVRKSSEEERSYASRSKEFSDTDLEVDDDPFVSVSEGGAFVSAWLWVPAPETEGVAQGESTFPSVQP